MARFRPAFSIDEHTMPAILLLLLGTLAAAAAGPITVPLSWWILDLRFVIGPMFYTGLGLVTVSLLFSC
jgi:hypothetical protein